MPYTLGQKIRELRIRKGLTQGDLSAGLVTPSMVSQIESDKANPSHQLLCAIAERLETPVEYFLTDVQTQMENVSMYQLACAYIGNGQYNEAISLLSHLKEIHASHISMIDVSYQLARCYLEIGSYQQAIELFDYVFETALTKKDLTLTASVENQLARIACKRKEYPIAAHYLEKAYESLRQAEPMDRMLYTEVLHSLSKVYTLMGEFDKANHYLAQSYKSVEHVQGLQQMGEIYLDLAASCREKGAYERAAEYAQMASAIYRGLEGMRQSIDIVAHYAVLLGREGQNEQAANLLIESIRRYCEYGYEENLGELHEELAQVLFQVGRYEEAWEHGEKALQYFEETDANRVKVYRLMAYISIQRDDLPEAEKWMELAGQLLPDNGRMYDQIKMYALQSEIFKKKKKYKEAIECLEKMNRLMENSLQTRKILM